LRIITTIFFCLVLQSIFSQNNFDQRLQYFIENSQYDSARVIILSELRNEKISYKKKASIKIRYAEVLKSLAKSDSCFYYLESAEKTFRKLNDTNELFRIFVVKAEISRYIGNSNLANDFIYKAEKLFLKSNNSEYKYYYLNRRIAILAQYYNNIQDSVVKIHKLSNLILADQVKIKDKSIIVYTLNEIGFLSFVEEPKTALYYFLKAFKVAEKYDTKIAYVDVSINLGRYYQQKEGYFSKAIYYYQKGLKKAKEINNLWQMQQIYNELKNTTFLSKDYENAMHYSDSLNGINILLNEYENRKKYEFLENNYIIQKKEKELVASKKNQLLLFIILLFLFTGLATLWFYSNKIRKSKKTLEKLNTENEFLISETNHRINNNLQLISLLINETIRKNKAQSKEDKDLIRLQSKIQSIALLHRELYASKDKKTVDLQLYFTKIEESFSEICINENIILKLNVDSVISDSDSAMYMGLMVTELIMNSIKYAFKEDQIKNIAIEIIKIQDQFEFSYSDNGQKNKSQEINPILVKQLCQQMGVHPEIIINNGFHLSFKKSL
jgi:two-component system, sensor histidine kinase PdtaS